jgi:hypothetical protein
VTDARNARTSVRVAFATATLSADITSTASITLARFAVAATATHTIPAVTSTAAVTLAPMTVSASAALTSPAITATADITLARFVTEAGSVSAPPITSTAAVTLRRMTVNARPNVHPFILIPPNTCDVAFEGEPFKHWSPWCRGENLFALADGTYSINQPANNENVVKIYWGGHLNIVSDPEEYAALVAAGFGEFIFPETPEMAP